MGADGVRSVSDWGVSVRRGVLRRAARFAAMVAFAASGCAPGGDDGRMDTISGRALPPHSTVTAGLPPDVVIDPAGVVDVPELNVAHLEVSGVLVGLYSPTATLESAVASIENGEAFREILAVLSADPVTQTLQVDSIGTVELEEWECEAAGVPSPCAQVRFMLRSGAGYPFPEQTQLFFDAGDRWVVSAASFCGFLRVAGVQCDDSNTPVASGQTPGPPPTTTTTTTTTTVPATTVPATTVPSPVDDGGTVDDGSSTTTPGLPGLPGVPG